MFSNIYLGEFQEEYDIYDKVYDNLKIIEDNFMLNYDNISLFEGLAGIIVASDYLEDINNEKNQILNNMIKIICECVYSYMKSTKDNVNINNCNCKTGLSGVGRGLLKFKDRAEVRFCLQDILEYLIQFVYKSKKKFDHNKLVDNGIINGVCSMLSFFSIAIKEEIEVKNQRDAIRILLDELYEHKYTIDGINYWYQNNSINNKIINLNFADGVIGIARAIYLAGMAVKDERYINDAVNTTIEIANFAILRNDVQDITFGYGISGILHMLILYNAENNVSNKNLDILIDKLVLKIVNQKKKSKEDHIDGNCNMLTKEVFESLVLLQLIKEKNTVWDKMFLIN